MVLTCFALFCQKLIALAGGNTLVLKTWQWLPACFSVRSIKAMLGAAMLKITWTRHQSELQYQISKGKLPWLCNTSYLQTPQMHNNQNKGILRSVTLCSSKWMLDSSTFSLLTNQIYCIAREWWWHQSSRTILQPYSSLDCTLPKKNHRSITVGRPALQRARVPGVVTDWTLLLAVLFGHSIPWPSALKSCAIFTS